MQCKNFVLFLTVILLLGMNASSLLSDHGSNRQGVLTVAVADLDPSTEPRSPASEANDDDVDGIPECCNGISNDCKDPGTPRASHIEQDGSGGTWYDDLSDDSSIDSMNNLTFDEDRIVLKRQYRLGDWKYAAWNRRALLNVINPCPKDLFGYQLPLNLSWRYGMREDFDDLRFTLFNHTDGTEDNLPYWIEDRENGNWARIWINVSDINGGGETALLMYFGNPEASGVSSGDDTFLFFDNFSGSSLDLDKWRQPSTNSKNSYSVTGGALLLKVWNTYANSIACRLKSDMRLDGTMIEARQRMRKGGGSSGNSDVDSFGFTFRKPDSSWKRRFGRSKKENAWLKYGSTDTNQGTKWKQGVWDGSDPGYHVLGISKDGNDVTIYEDLSRRGSIQDAGIISERYTLFILNVVWGSSGGGWGDLWTDWFRVRNHVSPEPRIFISPENGTITSESIALPGSMSWDRLSVLKTEYSGTHINVTVLDAETGNVIPGYDNLTERCIDISGLNEIGISSIKLRGWFDALGNQSAVLDCWGVEWMTGNAWRDTFLGDGKLSECCNLTAGKGEISVPDWWNYDWKYRREMTVFSTEGISDFQVLLDIESGEFDYDLAQEGGEDVRFIDGDGLELYYWIGHWNNAGSSSIYVNVTEIESGYNTIWMYYGNDAAGEVSDGEATFDFFDDFGGGVLDAGKWVTRTQGSTSVTVEDGYVRLHSDEGNGNKQHIAARRTFSPGIIMDYRFRQENSRYQGQCSLATNHNASDYRSVEGCAISHRVRGGYGTQSAFQVQIDDAMEMHGDIQSENVDQWYNASLILDSHNQALLRDGALLDGHNGIMPEGAYFPFFSEISPWDSAYRLDLDIVIVRKCSPGEINVFLGSREGCSNSTITSELIEIPEDKHWSRLFYNKQETQHSSINISVLHGSTGETIDRIAPGTRGSDSLFQLDAIRYPSIRLKAEFMGSLSEGPRLLVWGVNWTPVKAPELVRDIEDVPVEEDCTAPCVVDLADHFTDIYSRVIRSDYSIISISDDLNLNVRVNGSCLDVNDLADNWTGSATVTVRCEILYGLGTDSNEFSIVITGINDPPFWTSTPPSIEVDEDGVGSSTYSLLDHIVDCDSGNFSFSAAVLDLDLSGYSKNRTPGDFLDVEVNDTGHVQLAAWGEYYGSGNITAFVMDDHGNATDNITIPVSIKPVNDPPWTVLTSPADNVTVFTSSVTLSWIGLDLDDPVEILSYDLYLGKDAEASLHTSDLRGTNHTLFDLEDGAIYRWFVVPYDGKQHGNCPNGTRSFVVDMDVTPPLVKLRSPDNGSIMNETVQNITWKLLFHSGAGARYHVYLGTSPDDLAEIGPTEDTWFKLRDLENGVTYYWMIVVTVPELQGRMTSGIFSFTIQEDWVPVHDVRMDFKGESVVLVKGDSITVNLTIWNMGNLAETVNLSVGGELKDHATFSFDRKVTLEAGDTIDVIMMLFANRNLKAKTYLLTVSGIYSGKEVTAGLDVVIEDEETQPPEPESLMWLWFIIAVILLAAIVGLMILIITRSRKKEEKERPKEMDGIVEAELESTPPSGITSIDLERLGIPPGGDPFTPANTEPFQGRISTQPYPAQPSDPSVVPLQYTLPDQAPAMIPTPVSTAPQLPGAYQAPYHMTDQTAEQPKALPQASSLPAVTHAPLPPSPSGSPSALPSALATTQTPSFFEPDPSGFAGPAPAPAPAGADIPLVISRPISEGGQSQPEIATVPSGGAVAPTHAAQPSVDGHVQAPPDDHVSNLPTEAQPLPSIVDELFPGLDEIGGQTASQGQGQGQKAANAAPPLEPPGDAPPPPAH